jgi:DNA-binding LacI/PurR family transcriptional regulator
MSAGEVGRKAFEALFRLMGPDRPEGNVYQVPTMLVVRGSTAPLNRARRSGL